MREYLKLFSIRIIIYILLLIILFFFMNVFHCSNCYIENSLCLGGYGGLNIISVLTGYIIPIVIFELCYWLISKKTNIRATKLTIIMLIIFVTINLGIFKLIAPNSDINCNYCAVALCNDNPTNCSFIDEDYIKRENLNCSNFFN